MEAEESLAKNGPRPGSSIHSPLRRRGGSTNPKHTLLKSWLVAGSRAAARKQRSRNILFLHKLRGRHLKASSVSASINITPVVRPHRCYQRTGIAGTVIIAISTSQSEKLRSPASKRFLKPVSQTKRREREMDFTKAQEVVLSYVNYEQMRTIPR